LEEECAAETGSQGQLLIRPEAAELLAEGEQAENRVSGQIVETSFRGRYQIAQIAVTVREETIGLKFSFEMERPLPPPGSQVQLGLSAKKCRFFEGELNREAHEDHKGKERGIL
jgi:ABC-type Fe3+/spermidine/putrescine transport system ATPase subunit